MEIRIYDATLTEGAREPGLQLSVRDKLRVALRLAELGVAFVEAGWPGGRADAEIFREARRLELGGARLCACAALPLHGRAETGGGLKAALRSGAHAVTLFVPMASGTDTSETLATSRVAAGVHAVQRAGCGAVVELDGVFDVIRKQEGWVRAVAGAASAAGAESIVLSDTTGRALPQEVEAVVSTMRRATGGRAAIGVRARDDAGVAVANSLAAVGKGAALVVATVNGYGERCGAADLASVVAALELKMGHRVLAPGQLQRLTSLAHFVAELADREVRRNQPYVGRDAFALNKRETAHVLPEAVGNRAEAAMADERGHPSAVRAARAMGLPSRDETQARRALERLAEWEKRGFRYEGAEASFELLLRSLAGKRREYFQVLSYCVLDVQQEGRAFTEATTKVAIGREKVHTAAQGVGPVNALDQALRGALERYYPQLADMQLVQSRSRNLSSAVGTAGPVRVVIESADARDRWGTAGVSDNLLQACCAALVDAVEYKLLKDGIEPRGRRH